MKVVIEDLPYVDRDGEMLLARIYRPTDANRRAAAVADVHPGAWSDGDRTWGQVYNEGLARRGFWSHPSTSAKRLGSDTPPHPPM
jgi:hypothetical protein